MVPALVKGLVFAGFRPDIHLPSAVPPIIGAYMCFIGGIYKTRPPLQSNPTAFSHEREGWHAQTSSFEGDRGGCTSNGCVSLDPRLRGDDGKGMNEARYQYRRMGTWRYHPYVALCNNGKGKGRRVAG